jgi:TetR/AcrR family transcriptional regulator
LDQAGGEGLDGENSTRQKILAAGKREFLEKGFQDASLRNIVKQAGVTTGAFYGYFPDKQSLFGALVSPATEGFWDLFAAAHRKFEALPQSMQKSAVFEFSVPFEKKLLLFIYDHFDEFKLLLFCAGGTSYSGFLNMLVEAEVSATLRFIEATNNDAIKTGRATPELLHILSSAYFTAVFEVVAHDMAKENAFSYAENLREFFTAGWKHILRPEV